MADIVRYVDPAAVGANNGTSWGDAYTSLNAWESGEDQNLTDLAGDVAICYVRSSGAHPEDTTELQIDGWTTNSTCYIDIKAESTDRAVSSGWDDTKYRLVANGNHGLYITEDYVRVDGLQIKLEAVAAGGQSAILVGVITATNNYIQISNCRILGCTDATNYPAGIRFNDADIIANVWNTIVYGFKSVANSCAFYCICSTVGIYNCVMYDNVEGCLYGSGTVTIKNCASFNNTDDFDAANTVSYCASDDNDDDVGGTNVVEDGGGASWTGDFAGAATGNFTLIAGSGLIGTGTDNPSAGLYSDDINRETRTSTWDVGADEYISTGTTTGRASSSASRRRKISSNSNKSALIIL